MSALSLVHRYVPATKAGVPPLLLLHGTGGDENDLLPLGEAIAPGAALLSPRGTVLENGMPRFFRRLAEGAFDIPDLMARTYELADFVASARAEYGLAPPIAVGFSNGANIAVSLLLTQPSQLAGAVLMRAVLPFEPPHLPQLNGRRVLLLSGEADPLVPAASSNRLAAALKAAGANVDHDIIPAGHNLTQKDVVIAKNWLEQFK